MVTFPALIFVITALGAYWARSTLMANNFHRRMILMVLAVSLGYVVIPLLSAGAGYDNAQGAFIGMVATGLLFLLAGALIRPALFLSCLILWGGALLIGGGAPALAVNSTTSLLTMLVLAMSWSYVPPARNILGLGAAAGSTRRFR